MNALQKRGDPSRWIAFGRMAGRLVQISEFSAFPGS